MTALVQSSTSIKMQSQEPVLNMVILVNTTLCEGELLLMIVDNVAGLQFRVHYTVHVTLV